MNRQSVATGAWVAMWLITSSSMRDLELVELGVLRFDRGGELLVAFDERAHGQGEIAVGQAGHHEQCLANVGDLLGGRAVGVGTLEVEVVMER